MIKKLKQYSPIIYVGFCVCIMLIITGILLIVATVKKHVVGARDGQDPDRSVVGDHRESRCR